MKQEEVKKKEKEKKRQEDILKAKKRRKEKKQFDAYKEFKQKLAASERNYDKMPYDSLRNESESSSTARNN
jgi:hypothetical protein